MYSVVYMMSDFLFKSDLAYVSSVSVGSCAFFVPISARSNSEKRSKSPATETLATQGESDHLRVCEVRV